MVAVDLVDDLRDTDDLALVVDDGHGQDAVGLVAGLPVDLLIESWVLLSTEEVLRNCPQQDRPHRSVHSFSPTFFHFPFSCRKQLPFYG